MIKKSCPRCKTLVEINEAEYKPGETVVKRCPLCEERITFHIPKEDQKLQEQNTMLKQEMEALKEEIANLRTNISSRERGIHQSPSQHVGGRQMQYGQSKRNTTTNIIPESLENIDFGGPLDPYFFDAARIVVNAQFCSESLIIRKLRISERQADVILNQLELASIISNYSPQSGYKVKISNQQELERLLSTIPMAEPEPYEEEAHEEDEDESSEIEEVNVVYENTDSNGNNYTPETNDVVTMVEEDSNEITTQESTTDDNNDKESESSSSDLKTGCGCLIILIILAVVIYAICS
ncbi:MAG: hypothetical protein K5864_01060 [Bacteroidales bacterium]|nr:hypothetical protein [Bacteroidales bacterium]